VSMDDKAIDFNVAFGAWAGAADRGEHLADEVLRDFQAGRLEAAEKARVQDHLAVCRDCLDLWKDLRAFSVAAAPRQETPADFEAAAFWRTLRPGRESARRPGSGSPRAPRAVPPAPAGGRRRCSPRPWRWRHWGSPP